MRNWIDIINNNSLNEGEVVSLSKFKSDKASNEYLDAMRGVVSSEADFFKSGKFAPMAKAYVDKGLEPKYFPKFYVSVSFRDFLPNPRAKALLAELKAQKFKIERTKYHKEFSGQKDGPWATKQISFEEARQIFHSRNDGKFGAYRPSLMGFRTTTVNNWDENGVGFSLSVLGFDYRRDEYGDFKQEDHAISDDQDWQEVADMMAVIKRSSSIKPV